MKIKYIHLINFGLFIIVGVSIYFWYFGMNFSETLYPNTINYIFLGSLVFFWLLFYIIQIKSLDKIVTLSLSLGLLALIFILPGFFGPLVTHWYY